MGSAGGVFTDQLAFGFRTEGFRTFPVTIGLGTDRLTFGFGRLAVGDTVGGLAHVHTFGTVGHFAGFVRAHRSAVRPNFSFIINRI